MVAPYTACDPALEAVKTRSVSRTGAAVATVDDENPLGFEKGFEMDTMTVTKFFGAATSALLIFVGLNFFSELIYHHHSDGEELAFAMEIEESSDESAEVEEIDLAAVFAAADIASGEKVFKKCAACHKLEPGANGVGPYLHGIVGRPVGAASGFDKYSGALPAGEWTPEHLFAFLEKPTAYASGTSMNFRGLSKPADRADLIAYLASITDTPIVLSE